MWKKTKVMRNFKATIPIQITTDQKQLDDVKFGAKLCMILELDTS
jgi:hypothetical protein